MSTISFDSSDMEYSDTEALDDNDYYNMDEDCDLVDPSESDPEHFVFECMTTEDVERLLVESVEILSNNLQITPSIAKVLLHAHGWLTQEILLKYRDNSLLLNGIWRGIATQSRPTTSAISIASCSETMIVKHSSPRISQPCPVCTLTHTSDKFYSLPCNHLFCKDCWVMHLQVQILQGISTDICCMATGCDVLVPEDLVLKLMPLPELRDRYQQFAFQDYVRSHPQLRFCPGVNCTMIFRAKESRAKRVTCSQCKIVCCFKCGTDYHAPTDCGVIKKWLTKCADDSETANYISAHTKDCPKCHICIEKNGGCNHMQCYNCKYDFCWMCLGDWKVHGSEYYECSKYKENPNIEHESVHAQAREALKKYLHYYERWENHSRSLRLEKQTLERLKSRINREVMSNRGTWIDWQYLFAAASLLAKCRYTLQYTYPYAYFMEPGPRKELFEYQQAQLEAKIENLSWKVERAESTDRADLENQMDVAEKRRVTLLKDFLDV